MKPSTKSLWTVASLGTSAAVLFCMGRLSAQGAEPRAADVAAIAAPSASVEVAGAADASRTSAVEAPTPGERWGTVRELLEEYYGLPWSDLEGMLDGRLVDPEKRTRLAPWDEIAASFRSEIVRQSPEDQAQCVRDATSWGGLQTTPDWYGDGLNPGRKQLAEIDVQNLERVANEYESRLHDLADVLNQTMPRCMADQWDRGAFVHVPLCDTKDAKSFQRDPKSGITRLVTSVGGGWRVYFRFQSSAYPELESIAREIHDMKTERARRCREYIAAL